MKKFYILILFFAALTIFPIQALAAGSSVQSSVSVDTAIDETIAFSLQNGIMTASTNSQSGLGLSSTIFDQINPRPGILNFKIVGHHSSKEVIVCTSNF